jgi:hypothetical protein
VLNNEILQKPRFLFARLLGLCPAYLPSRQVCRFVKPSRASRFWVQHFSWTKAPAQASGQSHQMQRGRQDFAKNTLLTAISWLFAVAQ